MSCAACARRIERQLGRTPGVVAATVNFATSRARVVTSTGGVPTDKVIGVVEQTGFGASVITSPADALRAQQQAAQREPKNLTRRLIVAGMLTVPLLIIVGQVVLLKVDPTKVAQSLMTDSVLFIMGSLMLAVAIVRQRLDKRIAWWIVRMTGTNIYWISFGITAVCGVIAAFS